MGWTNVGIAAVGLVGAYLSKRAAKENAKDRAARDARAQARVDAGDPNQIVPDDQKKTDESATAPAAPPPPPSVTAATSNAVAQGTAAGIRQRKRAAAAGNPLFGRKAGAPAPTVSYAPKTLVGS